MIIFCRLTAAHSRHDDRLLIKECTSSANTGCGVTLLVADGKLDKIKNGVK